MSGMISPSRKLLWICASALIMIVLWFLFLAEIKKWSIRSQPGNIPPSTTQQGPPLKREYGSRPQPFGTEAQGYRMTFYVVDAKTEESIEGASLKILRSSEAAPLPPRGDAITDKHGKCELVLPPGTDSVGVRAPGYVSRRLIFQSTGDFSAEHTFRLERGIVIGGSVHDPDGKPIANVNLALRLNGALSFALKVPYREHPSSSLSVQSNSSGQWECTEIPTDPQSIALDLSHPEYAAASYTTDTPQNLLKGHVEIADLKSGKSVLIMKYGLLITGSVMDQNSRPIEGANVLRLDRVSGSRVLATTSTTADGRFGFTDATPGETVIEAQAKGFVSARKSVEVVPRMGDLRFVLARGHFVRGRVVDDAGIPMEGADVRTARNAGATWRGKTGADGRFLWESAPEAALPYLISSLDSKGVLKIVLDPDRDQEITLTRLLTMNVSGKVIDSTTKMPVEAFTVTALPSRLTATPVASATGSNGAFTITLNDRFPVYDLRIDASGYVPKTYPTVEFGEEERYLELAISRGDGPWGIVKLSSGTLIIGARVFLCGGNVTNSSFIAPGEKAPAAPMMINPKTIRAGQGGNLYYANTTTDEQGQFAFSPMPEAHTVVAVHEQGFVSATVDQLSGSHTLILQPWGKVEGTLRIGKKVGANARIRLRSLNYDFVSRPPEILVSGMTAQTDADGKFLFPMVPPGVYWVGQTDGQSTTATVRSGETVAVKLGGVGRPLTGTIVVANTDVQVDWKRTLLQLHLEPPQIPMPDSKDVIAVRTWHRTPTGTQWMGAQHSYAITIGGDGSFRVEDIPSGAYTLRISVTVMDPEMPEHSRRIETSRQVEVPQIMGGVTDTVFNVGKIVIQEQRQIDN